MAPEESNVETEVSPVTSNVPAVDTLPLVSATVNLLVSQAIPPLAFNAAVNVVIPVTSKLLSKVTASSTFNVPLTVVITADVAIFTTPPPVASDVAPEESNVETEVSPVTSNVPAVDTLPLVSATVNLLVSQAIPPLAFNAAVNVVIPVTSKVVSNVTA